MGLDIAAHSRLRRVQEATEEDIEAELGYEHGWMHPYVNPDFPGRADGIEGGWFYQPAKTHRFRAGSYGGYNEWRRRLAEMVYINDLSGFWANYDASKPFAELLHFSDCEGVIGPVASVRISASFEEFANRAFVFAGSLGDGDGKWFLDRYEDWRKAFALAADGGCVEFR